MRDPYEGLTAQGYITTGVRRDRIPVEFVPVVDAAIREMQLQEHGLSRTPVSLCIYGSVATGMAVAPASDVDLMTVGIPSETAAQISKKLSLEFNSICRGVEIATSRADNFEGDTDEAYGGRIFLRHYCVHLWGHKMIPSSTQFLGDARAARAFNGDIGMHVQRWLRMQQQCTPDRLGRSVARKTLLAVAGLVSVHDDIWTTDRVTSALRWIELHPRWHAQCRSLIAWSDGSAHASADQLNGMLGPDGLVCAIVDDFRSSIGLWEG